MRAHKRSRLKAYMEKVKLTQAQIDAINKALSHYGDASFLVEMHRNVINNGHEWSQWNALNELSVTTLSHALKYGFEVEEQRSRNSIHPIVALFQKEKQQELSKQALELDLDYQLASLYNAMQQGDQAEVARCKQRLAEIHKELESSK